MTGTNNSAVKVCKDRTLTSNTPTTIFCMQHSNLIGAHMNCTGDDSARDNVFSTNCTSGISIGTASCVPSSLIVPTSPGSCHGQISTSSPLPKAPPYLSELEKAPCDYFPSYAKTRSFYCIGINGNHLLMCPDNFITVCSKGCYSYLSWEFSTQIGKAACGAGSTPLPMPFANKIST